MSCNICQAKFSFFIKENGCPKCGFSYCSKCLKYKYDLSDIGEKRICGRCFNKLKKKDKPVVSTDSILEGLNKPIVPIDITKKLESLENPTKPPIIFYKHHSNLDKLKVDLDPIDQEIVNRLKKLKDEDEQLPLPTEDEIIKRLASLKNQDYNLFNQPININQVDTRTNKQKTDELIKKCLEKLNISKNSDEIDSDIQARLNNLKGIDSSKYTEEHTTNFEEEDETTASKKIIGKALAEAVLESKYDALNKLEDIEQQALCSDIDDSEMYSLRSSVKCPQYSKDRHNKYQDYFESCCMCEQTTDLVICKGCTGDLYCPNCFKDNHDDYELHKHKTVTSDQSRYTSN